MNTEQIKEIKHLKDLGITKEDFMKLILHCTDGPTETKTQYSNYKTVDDWNKLFQKSPSPNLNMSKEQIIAFFEYMSKYYRDYIGKSNNNYFVNKTFSNDKRREENFDLESIVYRTLEL